MSVTPDGSAARRRPDPRCGAIQLLLQHSYVDYRVGALRTVLSLERRFSSADLGMAAKPNHPVPWTAQLVEPFGGSGACVQPAEDPRVAERPIPSRAGRRSLR